MSPYTSLKVSHVASGIQLATKLDWNGLVLYSIHPPTWTSMLPAEKTRMAKFDVDFPSTHPNKNSWNIAQNKTGKNLKKHQMNSYKFS